MDRRSVLELLGFVGLSSLSGCIGTILGTVPKKFKIRNDRKSAAEVLVG
jgi:hypothetical protein